MIKSLGTLFLLVLLISESFADVGDPLNPKKEEPETYLHVCQNGDSLLVETNSWNNVDLKVFTSKGRLIIHSDIDEAKKTFPIIETDDRLYFMAKKGNGNIVADWVAVTSIASVPLACD